MDTTGIEQKFTEIFGKIPRLFAAPGRINLIGEHTDYNDGFVLPAAIDKRIIFALRPNDLGIFRFYSYDYDEYFETNKIEKNSKNYHWTTYLIGVLAQLDAAGISISGIDCVFGGNIPIGAGLSSSAAIECGFAFGLNEMFDGHLSKFQIAKLAQKAEHEYAGVMCGIMDQYASMFGKEDHVFRLDCRAHTHQYFPFEMDQYVIALCDTQVKHELASSEYNVRRQQCEKGVAIIQQFDRSIVALRDVTIELMEKHKQYFDPDVYKRCLYVVKENDRVIKACMRLSEHDFIRFGELMYQSHEGLKNEYEVSCDELDLLVDITREMEGVPGARMMGGGFGGCTINLVKRSFLDKFTETILSQYFEVTKIMPHIHLVNITGGAKSLIT